MSSGNYAPDGIVVSPVDFARVGLWIGGARGEEGVVGVWVDKERVGLIQVDGHLCVHYMYS